MTWQVLKVDWNTDSDTFSVHHRDIPEKTTQGAATKGQLIQTNARFYDKLGLFSPVSAIAKIRFQETWGRGIQWEEILPHDIEARWHAWINSLLLADNDIPRWIGTSKGHNTQKRFP